MACGLACQPRLLCTRCADTVSTSLFASTPPTLWSSNWTRLPRPLAALWWCMSHPRRLSRLLWSVYTSICWASHRCPMPLRRLTDAGTNTHACRTHTLCITGVSDFSVVRRRLCASWYGCIGIDDSGIHARDAARREQGRARAHSGRVPPWQAHPEVGALLCAV